MKRPTFAPALLFLLAALAGAAAEPPRTIAIDASPEVAAEIRQRSFFTWELPGRADLSVEVGEGAAGRSLIKVDLWPLDDATRGLLRGLPLSPDGEALRFDGTAYPSPGLAAGLRLPQAAGTVWLVTAYRAGAAARLVDELLFRLAGPAWRGGAGGEIDYLLRDGPYLSRQGFWRRSGERVVPDRSRELDELAERGRFFARLRPVTPLAPAAAELPGGRLVELLAQEGDGAGLARRSLAADLEAAAAEMGRRLPLRLEKPLTAVVEASYVTQIRHAGAVGEAVPGGLSGYDLHLVEHPADGWAYRFVLAQVLVKRSGLAADLPPWLARGAALWLAGAAVPEGSWYGRSYGAWLPQLAAARALPRAEQLLAPELPPDAPTALWTPAAAAVIEALPGATLAEKLARPPGRPQVEKALGELASGTVLEPARPQAPDRALPADGGLAFRGVSFAMLNSLEGGYHAPAVDADLARLAGLGADAVSIMPFAYQPAPDRPEIRFLNRSPTSETEIGCLHAARRARARGFRVLWKPHLWVGGDSWTGEVQMPDEESWARWWASYRSYLLHHAVLARWAGAEVFSIGVELGQTLDRQREWAELIADLRILYPGALTYAANWWGDVEKAPFWEQLDFVGIDAYYPLSPSPSAGAAELAAGARAVAAGLEREARRLGKPVLLTEVGFSARRGSWVDPHGEGGEYHEEDQAAAYRALFAALRDAPWLRGVFVWKAFSGGSARGGEVPDFRFLDRLAEEEVRRFFAAGPEAVAGVAASGSRIME